MKSILLSLLFLTSYALQGFAQVYSLSSTTATYVPLTNGTSLNMGDTWDDPEYAIYLGFDYTLVNETVNRIYIEDYGLGAYLSTTQTETGVAPMLVAYGPDILDRGLYLDHTESEISYEITGSVGSRIVKFQWANFGFYGDLEDDDTCTDYGNMQLWLYEGSNDFEIRFGPNSITQKELAYEFFPGPFIGIIERFDFDNDSISGASFLSGDPANPSITHADTISFMNDNVPNGAVYRFYKKTASVSDQLTANFNMYPNPAANEVTFEFTTPINGSLSLLNMEGKIIQQVSTDVVKMDLSNVARGVYFIEIQTDSGLVRQKLVLQ